MGRLGSELTFPVSCLILVWAAGSGAVQVRHRPTCFSDYLSTSTCEWSMGGPTDCSAELRLTYQLDSLNEENHTCVPANGEGAVCLCDMLMENVSSGDIYQLALWAGTQRLWSGSFKPGEHVKPRAPGNLAVHAPDSHTWQLTWSNPYPANRSLHAQLSFLVNISNEDDPTELLVRNVTYQEPSLRFPASALMRGARYGARVRAWAPNYNSLWSEWSPPVMWLHDYERPWEQRLPLAVGISCVIIMAVCLSCYFSILKIKREWWDRIPSPARSPVVAVVIQEPQVPMWGKSAGGREPAKCPYWKTCLTQLLPCLLGPGVERGDSDSQAARSRPAQGPGQPAWRPTGAGGAVLWPERSSVVACVELLEAPAAAVAAAAASEEEEEEDGGSFCPSPEHSGGGLQEGRAGIAARLTEHLLLDLLGGAEGGPCPPGCGKPLLPPLAGASAPVPRGEVPGEAPPEASLQGREQPSGPERRPAARTQSRARLAVAELPAAAVVTDNPAYRSFSSLLRPPSGPGELDSDPQLAEDPGDRDPNVLPAPRPSGPPAALQPEPETWEQGLRQSVLQHRAAAPPSAPGGYRQFAAEVRPGGEAGPPGDAGYKAFSSLLASGAGCPGPRGVEASSGDGGYRPFQDLTPGSPAAPAPVPLFTFGLDTGPPPSPQNSLLLIGSPECPGLEPAARGKDSQKRPLAPEQATTPLGDDLGSGIVYSALTCHLCGRLKQCHGREEPGEAHGVAPRCCGCRCGDGSEARGSPLPGGVLLEAGLPPASLAPLGVSGEGKAPLFFQSGPSDAQSSSQTPRMVAMLSTGPTGTSAS